MTTAVQVRGEVLGAKRVGAHRHVTLVAPGVPERFRPGNVLAVAVGGPLSDRVVRATYPIHRVRATGAYGGTVELVITPADPASEWLAAAPAGTALDVVG